jgi:hypothetical protein
MNFLRKVADVTPAVESDTNSGRYTLEEAESALAKIYRITGEDPDGNEDWRLAPQAIEAVTRLRERLDEQEAERGGN